MEPKRLEEELSRFFMLSLDMLCIAGFDGYFKRLNLAWTRTLGWTEEELLAKPYIEFVHPEDREATLVEAAKLGSGKEVVSFENRYRCKDGSYRWVVWNSAAEPEAQLIYAVAHDISERKKTEEALKEINDMLEQRVGERTAQLQAKSEEVAAMTQQLMQAAKLATMGELAASIAHELNNPLATVSLRVESLIAQVAEGDPKHKGLRVIEQECERMANLVANLLQFSRRTTQQISTVDVREEIENTLELVHYRLRNQRIVCVREFAPEVPFIQADRSQLRQLLLNLMNNSIDAMMGQGSGTLTIRVGKGENGREGERGNGGVGGDESPIRPLSHSPTHIVIEIADTGTGIPPEDLPRIMEPFFTTKPEGRGTGLGMAICKRIVEEHNGTLEIHSEVGKGTTVRVVLPVANGRNSEGLRQED